MQRCGLSSPAKVRRCSHKTDIRIGLRIRFLLESVSQYVPAADCACCQLITERCVRKLHTFVPLLLPQQRGYSPYVEWAGAHMRVFYRPGEIVDHPIPVNVSAQLSSGHTNFPLPTSVSIEIRFTPMSDLGFRCFFWTGSFDSLDSGLYANAFRPEPEPRATLED